MLSIGRPNPTVVVEVLEDPNLITGGNPPCAGLPAQKAALPTAARTTALFMSGLTWVLVVLMVGVRFHMRDRKEDYEHIHTKKRKKGKWDTREGYYSGGLGEGVYINIRPGTHM